MQVKILLVSVGLASFLCGGARSSRILHGNNIWEEDFAEKSSDDDSGASEPEFYDLSSTGPGKLPIDIFDVDRSVGDEGEKGKFEGSEVDEETIRKAEKMADKDLLNGLNRILKNNETLEDVFRSENVYEIP